MPDAVACYIKLYAVGAKFYNRVNTLVQFRRLQGFVINTEEWALVWDKFFNFVNMCTMEVMIRILDIQ